MQPIPTAHIQNPTPPQPYFADRLLGRLMGLGQLAQAGWQAYHQMSEQDEKNMLQRLAVLQYMRSSGLTPDEVGSVGAYFGLPPEIMEQIAGLRTFRENERIFQERNPFDRPPPPEPYSGEIDFGPGGGHRP